MWICLNFHFQQEIRKYTTGLRLWNFKKMAWYFSRKFTVNEEWAYSVDAYLSICRSVGLHCNSLLSYPSYSRSPEVNCVTTWRKTSKWKEGACDEHVMSRRSTLLPMFKIGNMCREQSIAQSPFNGLVCLIYLDAK